MIVIFSRAIRTGKTTELMHWCRLHPEAGGLLMPDIDGVRFFEEISSGNRWPAQAAAGEAALEVGRFRFSGAAFDRAIEAITKSAGAAWLVVDEVGKLELDGLGFDTVLQHLLLPAGMPENLLLVVRDGLLNAVVERYALQEARVIHNLGDL